MKSEAANENDEFHIMLELISPLSGLRGRFAAVSYAVLYTTNGLTFYYEKTDIVLSDNISNSVENERESFNLLANSTGRRNTGAIATKKSSEEHKNHGGWKLLLSDMKSFRSESSSSRWNYYLEKLFYDFPIKWTNS